MATVATQAPRRETGGIPAEVTSFVGRRQASADVKRALSESRLVTLTGVGGVGKTRLALHVAQSVSRAFPHGAWMVELAKLDDPSLVGNAVVTALRLTDSITDDPETVLTNYLANKRLLLVLDNCEHLLDSCARLTHSMLVAAPNVRVLATSREPLNISGEHIWPVPPLSVPTAGASLTEESAHRYEALQLFEQRASAAVPGFTISPANEETVARLCQQLEGLPLAIELAAVRLRALSVEEILERLEDRYRLLTGGGREAPPRHQSLRAAIEWSFDLCSELERTLWATLSVFAGDFDMEAAQVVCAVAGLAPDDVFNGMVGLVEKSVMSRKDHSGHARYQMLETIRQFGREQLNPIDERAIREGHRDYYLRLVEEAEADWFGPHQMDLLRRFAVEQPNIFAALEFCLTEAGEARTGMRLAYLLWWYWFGVSIRDGRYWLGRALALDQQPSNERAQALWVDGWFSSSQGNYKHALPVLHECRDLARELGDELTLGHAMQFIGLAKWFEGRLPEAVTAHEEALVHYRAAGAVNSLTALAMIDLGMTVAMLGDPQRDVALCEQAIAMCQERGERWAQSWGLWHIAFARWLLGDLAQVNTYARSALELKRHLDHVGVAWCVELLAWSAAASGQAEHAAVLFGIAETLWEPIGGGRLSGWQGLIDWSDERREQARKSLGAQAFQAAFDRGRGLAIDVAFAYALGESPTVAGAEESFEGRASTRQADEQLTRREREVAELVANGLSNKDVAATLVISQRTAECHVDHILRKLGFTSRTQVAAWFIEQRN
ncbi:LuxR C-terminal-related transcriptional regulator [Actinopolymorpha sp. B17G11]|uniref:LuxR C-terminal-related transcriptional regulator n=1 Tax=Actinopolymorpha sp. B17G11 TaxID=3160861 RepID=UPI0032E4E453